MTIVIKEHPDGTETTATHLAGAVAVGIVIGAGYHGIKWGVKRGYRNWREYRTLKKDNETRKAHLNN